MNAGSDRLADVIAAIDAANASDPREEVVDGQSYPKELIYAQRMSASLSKLYPDASDALKIAARAQHICRWQIPRETYPTGRVGYNEWRAACRDLHATLTREIMRKHGYDDDDIAHVVKLIRKQDLKRDPESQALENVVGVVFVEYYLADFAKKHEEDKVITILRKTGRKMSEEGLQAVKALDFSPDLSDLIHNAFG